MANSWARFVAPIVDKVHGSRGYVPTPDVALMYRLPAEKSNNPLPMWMIALWGFSVMFTFAYWLALTSVTYGIGRA